MSRQPQHAQQGMIFVTAIVILVVLLGVGTSFLGMSAHELSSARKEHEAVHALAMADAGVNYMVWKQKHSNQAIPLYDSRILPSGTNPYWLGTAEAPQPLVSFGLGDDGQDRAAVWLIHYDQMIDGIRVQGYQTISRGYYRNNTAGLNSRTIRAVLQPPPAMGPTTSVQFPQIDYTVYCESDLYVASSSNVNGNNGAGLGTNGSMYLSTSNGGYIRSHAYSAAAIIFDKNQTTIQGNVRYGTKILDKSGDDITTNYNGKITGILSGGADTMLVPEMRSEDYEAWANTFGYSAFFSGTRLTTSDVVAREILYINPEKTPGYSLSIDCSIPKSATIFVNGDVVINGSVRLGVPDSNTSDGIDNSKPFAIIATGSVTCKGNPEINGIIWSKGAFGRGTPTVNGSIVCNNLAGFQGNNTLNFVRYHVPVIPNTAMNYEHAWRIASWEEL